MPSDNDSRLFALKRGPLHGSGGTCRREIGGGNDLSRGSGDLYSNIKKDLYKKINSN